MLKYLVNEELLDKNDRIAVGVSGGADSMVLLHALLKRQEEIGFYMFVINVNHHIRGAESDRDSKFVKDFCASRKIPCEVIDVDAIKNKTESKSTLEESARKLRYDVFFKIMKEKKLNKLFLAHNKDDQAETILMHIFRGSGISGAVGIKNSDFIIRPLIDFRKKELLKIAKDFKIDYVEDSTNTDNNYTRNYIRNIVIPDIEKVYPTAVDALAEFGKKCDEAQNFIMSKLDLSLIEEYENYILIRNSAFDDVLLSAREYIKIAFEKLKIYSDVEQKHYKLIYDLKYAEVNKQLDLPHQVIAKRTYDGIRLYKGKRGTKKNIEFEFVKQGEIEFPGFGKIKTSLVDAESVEYGENRLYVDINKIPNGAVWRTRRLGDVFSKLGTGSKKLNDYFTDKKIDSDLRDSIPVLASSNQILVVARNDISDQVKLDKMTEDIVLIEFL